MFAHAMGHLLSYGGSHENFCLSSGGKPDSCGRMWEMFSSPNQCSQRMAPAKVSFRMASSPFLFLFHGLILWIGHLMTGPAHANMPAAYQLETDWMLDAKPMLMHGMRSRHWHLHAAKWIGCKTLGPRTQCSHYRCRQSDDRCTHPAVHSTRGISDHRWHAIPSWRPAE